MESSQLIKISKTQCICIIVCDMIMVKPLCFLCFSIQKHCFLCKPFILLTSLFEKCYEILYIILDYIISVVLWLSFCSFTIYIHVYSRKNAYHILVLCINGLEYKVNHYELFQMFCKTVWNFLVEVLLYYLSTLFSIYYTLFYESPNSWMYYKLFVSSSR